MATGARVYETGTGFVSNNTWSALQFTSERWDYGSLHSNVTNNTRLTAPSKGVYVIVGHLSFPSNSTGQRGIRFMLNGATAIGQQMNQAIAGSLNSTMSLATIYELNTNDYVELSVYQNSGGSLSPNTGDAWAYEFGMHLIEAT